MPTTRRGSMLISFALSAVALTACINQTEDQVQEPSAAKPTAQEIAAAKDADIRKSAYRDSVKKDTARINSLNESFYSGRQKTIYVVTNVIHNQKQATPKICFTISEDEANKAKNGRPHQCMLSFNLQNTLGPHQFDKGDHSNSKTPLTILKKLEQSLQIYKNIYKHETHASPFPQIIKSPVYVGNATNLGKVIYLPEYNLICGVELQNHKDTYIGSIEPGISKVDTNNPAFFVVEKTVVLIKESSCFDINEVNNFSVRTQMNHFKAQIK